MTDTNENVNSVSPPSSPGYADVNEKSTFEALMSAMASKSSSSSKSSSDQRPPPAALMSTMMMMMNSSGGPGLPQSGFGRSLDMSKVEAMLEGTSLSEGATSLLNSVKANQAARASALSSTLLTHPPGSLQHQQQQQPSSLPQQHQSTQSPSLKVSNASSIMLPEPEMKPRSSTLLAALDELPEDSVVTVKQLKEVLSTVIDDMERKHNSLIDRLLSVLNDKS